MCETAKPDAFDAREAGAALGRHIREQQAAKAAANAQEAGRGGYASYGDAGMPVGHMGRDVQADLARPPRLRERVNNSLHHSQQAADRLQKLGELEYLLAKNPDVARILELVEETRV